MASKLINGGVTLNVIGSLLLIMGVLMLPSISFSIYYGEDDLLPNLFSALITLSIGLTLKLLTRKSKDAEIKKRDGGFLNPNLLVAKFIKLDRSGLNCSKFNEFD